MPGWIGPHWPLWEAWVIIALIITIGAALWLTDRQGPR